MRLLYLAWRYSGGRLCPYRTHHNLDADFRPLDWEGEPRPPASHRRLRNVLIGFAEVAEEEAVAMAGASMGRGL